MHVSLLMSRTDDWPSPRRCHPVETEGVKPCRSSIPSCRGPTTRPPVRHAGRRLLLVPRSGVRGSRGRRRCRVRLHRGLAWSSPTYRQVCDGTTGHAEVVRIEFDPTGISYREVLEIFFVIHDPTTLNRQGNDVGTQYRSAIYLHSAEQRSVAEDVIREAQSHYRDRSSPNSPRRVPTGERRTITRSTSATTRSRATACSSWHPRWRSSGRPSRQNAGIRPGISRNPRCRTCDCAATIASVSWGGSACGPGILVRCGLCRTSSSVGCQRRMWARPRPPLICRRQVRRKSDWPTSRVASSSRLLGVMVCAVQAVVPVDERDAGQVRAEGTDDHRHQRRQEARRRRQVPRRHAGEVHGGV